MTPRPTIRQPLHETLRRHHDTVRWALAARHALRGVSAWIAVVAAALALGALVPLGPGAAWLRFALVVALGTLALGAALRAYRRAAPAFDAYLESVEGRFPEIRSWLRNALDFEARPVRDTSQELAHAVAVETATRLESVPVATLTPRVEPRRPLQILAAALGVAVLVAVFNPSGVARSWRTLWRPALAAPPVRLVVEPGSVQVTPGAALAVRARVWGTTARPRLQRSTEGAVTAALEGRDAGGAHVWRFDLTQLTHEQRYRVKAAQAESPEYVISLAGEPQPLSFTFEYRAPAYARLPVQRGASTRGDLTALKGSTSLVEATFDRDLESLEATLPDGSRGAWTRVTPRRWRGAVPVEREGEYVLEARAASGAAAYRYRVNPVGDAPPILSVLAPETDMDLPAGQQIPLEIVGQDDLGLSELRLQHRKDPSAPWTDVTLSRFAGEPREARVATRWDAASLALLPGESATFRFELYDDNAVSGRGRAVSRTFELRFPSMAELYDKIDRGQESVQHALEKVAERANELQKSLDQLARQPRATPSPQSPQNPRSQPQSQNFERTEEMRQALEQQQELAKQIDQAAEQLKETLEQSQERQAFNETLQRKLQEIAELMKQIQSQELRDAMKRLQDALEKMDPMAMERTLPSWQQQNKEMLEHLDRSIDLLKKLREEEQMQALAQRAEELRRQQDALNQEHDRAGEQTPPPGKNVRKDANGKNGKSEKDQASEQNPSDPNAKNADDNDLAQRQEQAAQRTEQLAGDVEDMKAQLDRSSEREAMEKAAQELGQQAADAQRDAAQQTQSQQSKKAGASGRRASEHLKSAAGMLQELAQQREEEREGVDLAMVRRAAKDLVSLQRGAEDNLSTYPDAPQRADRQTDLSEGVARVADSLYTLAQRSPFITPKLAQSLGRAMEGLATSGRELAAGNRRRGETSGQDGAESLNEAILELRRTEQAMSGQNQGGTQQGGSTAQRLGEMGEKQSQLNGETRSIAERLSEQMRLSAGDQQALRDLAERQRRIREQIEQIQRDDEREQKLLGRLDKVQEEMKESEEAIRSGSGLDELPAKQQRILSRLLDAQRSVHRRDFDPQRESRTAEDVPSVSPPELPGDLLRQSDRLRLDLLKAESDRYPAQYRAFIEAYLRSLNRSHP